MTYRILTADRKEVKTKLEELTGKKATYSGAPSFAYELDGISIGTNGTVTTSEEADESLLHQLVDAGLLEGHTGQDSNGNDKAEEVSAGEETAPETPQSGTPEAENEAQEAEAESVERAAAETESVEQDSAETESQENEAVQPTISFPLSNHTAQSLSNLIFSIYSKGDLLEKSTGGSFFVSEALKEKLAGSDLTKDQVLEILKDAESGDLRGLSFTDGDGAFTGFPEAQDAEVIRAWTLLAAAINKSALTSKRILPRRNEETNEKFAFRGWLTRLGMNGPALKGERQIYYKNLTGHTAFRTPADEEKWKKRQAERKAERKAAEEAAQTAPRNTPEETNEETTTAAEA